MLVEFLLIPEALAQMSNFSTPSITVLHALLCIHSTFTSIIVSQSTLQLSQPVSQVQTRVLETTAAVHGVAEGRTRLSGFTCTFHFHALEKAMATHSSVLAWRVSRTGEPGGLRLWGRTESDTTEAT